MRRNRLKAAIVPVLAALAVTVGCTTAGAQEYPSRAITVVIPFAGGSASDVVSRIMLDRMAKSMGQPIIVENKPGAGGNSGTALAAKATPDGYTLVGAGSGPIAANLSLYKNLGYDPEKELAVISPFAGFTIVVAASNTLPVKSLKELIALLKANPGKYNYGSVGIGSSQHLAGEYFSQVTGTKLTHVPYRNIAQFAPDLMSGTVALGFQWFPNVAGPIQAKGATALAVAGDNRLAALPDTPRPILERLNKELAAALADPAVRDGFAKAGAEPMALSLELSAKFHSEEIVKYRNIIKNAGIAQIE
jgi:tripartite-type tricarboxylate transporter receptor subunit TctC